MRIFFAIFLLFSVFTLSAQDTLPDFSAVKKKDGTVNISWINDYGIVKQLTIQRSTDSRRGFVSLNTDSTPMNRKGFFMDKKAKMADYYYRIFIQLPEGKYLYTPVQKAYKEGSYPTNKKQLKAYMKNINIVDSIQRWCFGSFINQYANNQNISENTQTQENEKPWEPSDYIFTDKKGNILIALPYAESKNYSISFFDENNTKVLFIKRIQESNLILERYNFYKSGWYHYQILDDGKKFEAQKFYLPPLIVPATNLKNR